MTCGSFQSISIYLYKFFHQLCWEQLWEFVPSRWVCPLKPHSAIAIVAQHFAHRKVVEQIVEIAGWARETGCLWRQITGNLHALCNGCNGPPRFRNFGELVLGSHPDTIQRWSTHWKAPDEIDRIHQNPFHFTDFRSGQISMFIQFSIFWDLDEFIHPNVFVS